LSVDPPENPLDKLPPILKKNLRRNLCVCNEVLKIDIINAITQGATTVEEVRRQTYATMGSGCKQQVKRLIECLCEKWCQRTSFLILRLYIISTDRSNFLQKV